MVYKLFFGYTEKVLHAVCTRPAFLPRMPGDEASFEFYWCDDLILVNITCCVVDAPLVDTMSQRSEKPETEPEV